MHASFLVLKKNLLWSKNENWEVLCIWGRKWNSVWWQAEWPPHLLILLCLNGGSSGCEMHINFEGCYSSSDKLLTELTLIQPWQRLTFQMMISLLEKSSSSLHLFTQDLICKVLYVGLPHSLTKCVHNRYQEFSNDICKLKIWIIGDQHYKKMQPCFLPL